MLIPEAEEILVGEVVQFNPSAGYGFIRPAADSVFQQDVYFNIKESQLGNQSNINFLQQLM